MKSLQEVLLSPFRSIGPLALGVALVAAAGCGSKAQESSSLKIREGSVVSTSTAGPERVSTVGLIAQVPGGIYTCSAAVLSSKLLVTAAHCVEDGARIAAFFGLDMESASRDSYVPVKRALVHPDYDNDSEEIAPNDIAVLELGASIPAGFKPAPLLTSAVKLAADEQVRLAGFGITEEGEESGGVLRYVDTTYVGTDDDGRLEIDDKDRRGACSGDSGGPLYVKRGSTWYLGGVLSGGPIPCRGVNVYTGVATHADFIQQAEAQLGE